MYPMINRWTNKLHEDKRYSLGNYQHIYFLFVKMNNDMEVFSTIFVLYEIRIPDSVILLGDQPKYYFQGIIKLVGVLTNSVDQKNV